MKATFATVALLVTAAAAVAVPEDKGWYVRRAEEMSLENVPVVELSVTNDLFPGVTFTGTAESIYHEMKALNPASVIDEPLPEVSKRSLAKRSTFNCNWGSLIGSWNQCQEGVDYLRRLGTSHCGVNPSPAYARVSCSHSCGMYLYNKTGNYLWVHCTDIATDIIAIAETCQSPVFARLHGARDFDSHFIGLAAEAC